MRTVAHEPNSRNIARRPLRLSPGGTVVGHLEGRTAVFSVSRSRHWFRLVGGYSLDEHILVGLSGDCDLLRFLDSETGEAFEVGLYDFLANGKELDFGWGRKIAAPATIYTPVGQLPLFGGAPA